MEFILALIFLGFAGGIIAPFIVAILFIMAGLFGGDRRS